MPRTYHVRYYIGFYDADDTDTQVYSDFRNIIENTYHGDYTLDATFYLEFSSGIALLEKLINVTFDKVLKENNLTRRKCYLKYDICTESTPISRRICN